jgi:hypothetical protein
MKTTILTISLALASALSALAQTVMRENSTVYFKTNVYLHDDPTNPLHQRISVEGKEPLWVAASNEVVYYQGGEITNAIIHAGYINADQFLCSGDAVFAQIEVGGNITGANSISATNISANTITSKYVYVDGSIGLTDDLGIGGVLDFHPGGSIAMRSNNINTVGIIDARTAQVERVEISDSLYYKNTMYMKSKGIELGKSSTPAGSSLNHDWCIVFSGHPHTTPSTTAEGQAAFLVPGGFIIYGGDLEVRDNDITADGAFVDKVYFGTTNRSFYATGTNLYFYASGVVGKVTLTY